MIRRITAQNCCMSIESASIYEWEDRLSKSISRRGLSVSPQDILAVLSDPADPSAPLPHGERELLIEHAGLSREELTQEAADAADIEIAANRSVVAQDVQTRSLDTHTVSTELKMAPANERRAVREGTLFSVKTSPGPTAPHFSELVTHSVVKVIARKAAHSLKWPIL